MLTLIYQRSLDDGCVPADWREALIVSLNKKGSKHLSSNYRPVSLTTVACKVLEHIVHGNIMRHFDQLNILTDKQHGFRKRRSTVTQLIDTIQGLTSKLRSGKNQVDVILLDFTKAFDKVPHQRFLYKLSFYGIRRGTLYWIEAFLGHRKQQVLLDGSRSQQADVISGVPQGTVLGPCYSWPLLMTFLKPSETLILASSRTTACYTNSSRVMLMQSLSNKIYKPWRNGNESGRWSSTLRNARSSASSPTSDTRDTQNTGSKVTHLKLLTVESISVSPSATTSAGTNM